ncbi:MAG: hypothetical protein V3U76_05390 [Granulosicoccus sp.]
MKTDLSQTTNEKKFLTGLLLCGALALSACSSNDDDGDSADMPSDSDSISDSDSDASDTPASTGSDNDSAPAAETFPLSDVESGFLAFAATHSADYTSGRTDTLSLSGGISVTGSYAATTSDITVDTDGKSLYEIGRFGLDSITKLDPGNTANVIYQYSVNGDETSANPYDIAFVGDSLAYIARYGSSKVWVVNPSAASEEDFKIGELDLAAYDADVPNVSAVMIVEDRLFILMEALTGFDADKPGYIAVFDTASNTEIDTGQGVAGLKGIALETINPTALQYNATSDEVIVIGRGNFFENETVAGDPYTGGIEVIDGRSYENSLLLDDGSNDENEGFFVNGLIVSLERGYVVTYKNFLSTLRSFNPVTGLLDEEPVATLVDKEITSLAEGPTGKIWVGVGGDNPGFVLVDPVDNSISDEVVRTELIPVNVVFIDPSTAD